MHLLWYNFVYESRKSWKRISRRRFLKYSLALAAGLAGCASPQPDNQTVSVLAGTAKLGRTFGEISSDYSDCTAMAARTGQGQGICEPSGIVFGDNPSRTPQIDGFKIDKLEAHDPATQLPLQVPYSEAGSACQTKGGRLPTADQWEYAARGNEGRIWPWGNSAPGAGQATIDTGGGNPQRPVERVGSHPSGATPEGIQDMTGNVWEWVQGGMRKGGGSGSFTVFAKPAHQLTNQLISRIVAGFRCIYP